SGGMVSFDGNAGSSIGTSGKNAVGLLAQSVGGGGGLIRTLALDQQGDQSNNADDDNPDTHNYFLDFGKAGAGFANGNGGQAEGSLNGTTVKTTGRMAHGVVASSIGGGGGAVGGGAVALVNLPNPDDAGKGDGGAVQVMLDSASINVSGIGSNGIWASSIG